MSVVREVGSLTLIVHRSHTYHILKVVVTRVHGDLFVILAVVTRRGYVKYALLCKFLYLVLLYLVVRVYVSVTGVHRNYVQPFVSLEGEYVVKALYLVGDTAAST